MRSYALRLFEDSLAPDVRVVDALTARPRVVYMLRGAATFTPGADEGGHGVTRSAGEAWHGCGPVTLAAGPDGARVLRWELVALPAEEAALHGVTSTLKLEAPLELPPDEGYLMRCDRVDFPPGGVAYLHMHRGPGIRCLLEGEIRIDTEGASTHIAPLGAWFEPGPEPVFAAASTTRETGFARVMILPRELRGKSSIIYVNPGDREKPKPQRYTVYVDEEIALPRD